jgi:hypothetical protein
LREVLCMAQVSLRSQSLKEWGLVGNWRKGEELGKPRCPQNSQKVLNGLPSAWMEFWQPVSGDFSSCRPSVLLSRLLQSWVAT